MSYVSTVLADNPSFYWRLGESAGTTAEDTSPNNRDGTYSGTGVTYSQTGAINDGNTAVLLDGSAGTVTSAATLDLSATLLVSVEFWAKVTAFNNTDDLFYERTANWNSNNGGLIFDPCNAAGNCLVGMRVNGNGRSATFTRPSVGDYHHYVVVYDATAQPGNIIVYIDTTTPTLTFLNSIGPPTSFVTASVFMGSRNATSLFINATMDEFAIYPTALSAARVQAHFTAATAVASEENLAPVIYGRGAA